MARLLKALAVAVQARPGWFVMPQIVLFGLCVWYTATHLEFDMSRNSLVGADKKYHQIYLQYKKDFNVRDDLVVVIESEDREKNRQFVERLGPRMEEETNLFAEVFYKGDLRMLGPKALLFLEEPMLRELRGKLGEYKPFLNHFAQATNLNSLFGMINHQFRAAAKDTNSQGQALVNALPALGRIVDQGTAALRRSGAAPSPGLSALFGEANPKQQGEYLTFAEGRIYVVNARCASDQEKEAAVRRLRELVAETYREVPGVNAGVTGEPVLEVDEMEQSTKDSIVATVLSLVASALLFVVSYREVANPLKAVAGLVIGLGYTMGFTTAAVGHLNILTVTFLPILIGMAIDFGVHWITRFEEELARGHSLEMALERAMVNTGMGIFTGCLTTAGAFFAMMLTDFKGIQEMGIITGGGMVVCLIPMLTFLPALALNAKRRQSLTRAYVLADSERTVRARLEQVWLQRPRTTCAVVLGLSLLALLPLRWVRFDYNLLHMQSAGLPAVMLEHTLIETAGKSVLFGAVVATNQQDALRLEVALTNLPTVGSVDMMAKFLADQGGERLRLIGEVKEELADLAFSKPDGAPVEVEELSRTLWSLHGYLRLALEEVRKRNEREIERALTGLREAIEAFRHGLLTAEPAVAGERLGAYQRALFEDLRETFRVLREQDNREGLRVEDLPSQLRTRFIGANGKQLLQVYPKGDVWEREAQEAFVQDLRSVAPAATGTPVQLYEYTTLLKDSYVQAAYYSLGAIAVLVFVHFRRVGPVILSLLPVGIGTLWTAGLMGALGVPFNPANIMTLPLVVGIGVTNGIHILNRFAEEQHPSILARSTGKAVVVSAFTTIAGFGSLIPAAHLGIRSLGIVMSLGVAMCMIVAVTFLPALLTLLIEAGWKIKRPSGDNAQSTLGREEPRYQPQSSDKK